MAKSPVVVNLIPIEATSENFAEYGQIIEASRDGELFGPNDAQLDLSRGTPRLYIMPLKDTSFGFSNITHHAHVTQCLGSIGAHVWYVGVAKASLVEDDDERRVDTVESSFGHLYNPPTVEEVRVFRVSGPKFLKLNRGTWHAGPLFRESSMDFYNLELSDTDVSELFIRLWASNSKPIGNEWIGPNPLYITQDPTQLPMWDIVTDETTYDFKKNNGAIFRFEPKDDTSS